MGEERKVGTVETYPHVYEPIRQFGIAAKIWDEVLEGFFGTPFGELAGPFQHLLYELETQHKRSSDYPRSYGISDQDYIHGVLKKATQDFNALSPSLRDLISDDGWEYDAGVGFSKKRTVN